MDSALLRRLVLLTVVLLLVSGPARAQNLNMGSTYHALEASASELATTFNNGCAVTLQRLPDGTFAVVAAFSGGALRPTRVKYHPESQQIELSDEGGTPVSASVPSAQRVSLDWLNVQACSLAADIRAASALAPDKLDLQWRNGLFHADRIGKKDTSLEAWSDQIRTVDAVFGDVLVSTLVADLPGLHQTADSTQPRASWETTVSSRESGDLLGRLRWYEREGVLAWSFPGLTRAMLNKDNLGRSFPFQLNAAWGTVQAYALYYFHSRRADMRREDQAKGTLVQASCQGRFQLVQSEQGCDGLHWLDDTLFRPCCDSHDFCYEYYGCSYRSWWEWNTGWRCSYCNLAVVGCFSDTACYYMPPYYCP